MHGRAMHTGDSCVPRMTSWSGSSRFLLSTHATETRKTREDASCIEVQWIGYSIFSALGQPEDWRRLAGSFARPEDPTKAAYWPSVTPIALPLRCFSAKAHKSLNLHKGLLRFTDEFLSFLPDPVSPSDTSYANFFSSTRPTSVAFGGSLIFHCVNMAGEE